MDDDAPSPPPLEDFSRLSLNELVLELRQAASELDEMFERARDLIDRCDRVMRAVRRRGGSYEVMTFGLVTQGARLAHAVLGARFGAAPLVSFPLDPAEGVVSPADVRGRP